MGESRDSDRGLHQPKFKQLESRMEERDPRSSCFHLFFLKKEEPKYDSRQSKFGSKLKLSMAVEFQNPNYSSSPV